MVEHPMFFESWTGIWRLAVIGAASYFTLVAMLRITGKKTITTMNIFDFVFVVALGSVFASGIMFKAIPLAEGLGGLAVLILLRLLLQSLAKRFDGFESFLNGSPTLLYRNGKFEEKAMTADDVTREEILAAMRRAHHLSLADIEAVVLETDGTFSVVARRDGEVPPGQSTLADVHGAAEWETPAAKRLQTENSGDVRLSERR